MSKPETNVHLPGVTKSPNSLRAAQIILGALTMMLAGLVLVFPAFAVYLIAALLSVSLLFGGIHDIVIGAGAKHLRKATRAASIGVGVLAIAASLFAIAYPGAAVIAMSVLLAVALIFLGSAAVARGIVEKHFPGWVRAMLIGVGALTTALSFPIIVYPVLGVPVLLAILATALVIIGASYIAVGATGALFRPAYRRFDLDSKRNTGSEAA